MRAVEISRIASRLKPEKWRLWRGASSTRARYFMAVVSRRPGLQAIKAERP